MSLEKIENPSARIWTRSQLRKTVEQAKKVGCIVDKKSETTEIFCEGECILRSLSINDTTEMVRLNKDMFC